MKKELFDKMQKEIADLVFIAEGLTYDHQLGTQSAILTKAGNLKRILESLQSESDEVKSVITISDGNVQEAIEDALYATDRFLPEQCTELALGIISYLKDAERIYTSEPIEPQKQEELTLPSEECLKNHFNDIETYTSFINNLSDMLSHLSFEGRRKMIEAKKTTASMVLRFEEYGKLPAKEGYYLSLSKIGNVTLEEIKPPLEAEKEELCNCADGGEYLDGAYDTHCDRCKKHLR